MMKISHVNFLILICTELLSVYSLEDSHIHLLSASVSSLLHCMSSSNLDGLQNSLAGAVCQAPRCNSASEFTGYHFTNE